MEIKPKNTNHGCNYNVGNCIPRWSIACQGFATLVKLYACGKEYPYFGIVQPAHCYFNSDKLFLTLSHQYHSP